MLGAGLYWLLLPCTLLAGEWKARAGRLRPGSAALRRPAPRGCARASRGEEIPRGSRPRAPTFLRRERAGGVGGPGPGTEWKHGRQRRQRRGSPVPQIALGVSARARRRGPGKGLCVSET